MEHLPLTDITNRIEGILAKEVTKRNGSKQPMDLHKVAKRLVNLAGGLEAKYLNLELVINKVAEYA